MNKFFVMILLSCFCLPVMAQIEDFDEQTEGPWSDIDNTTITIFNVPSITLDGEISADEYGGFEGIEVIPVETGWVLNYATEKNWEGPDDSSFTFYVAYDDTFLYVALDVKDDVVRSNDENAAFWKDDAVEIVFGPENNRYDINTDGSTNLVGGHVYFNWEGRFSEWDEASSLPRDAVRFAAGLDWAYGEDAEVYGVGIETETGWALETRIHKMCFEDEDLGTSMVEGEVWDFNVGLDDDDGGDLAVQYWWASRVFADGFSPDNEFFDLLLDEEIETQAYLDPENEAAFWPLILAQPLGYASCGELIFGPQSAPVIEWAVY